MADGDSALDIEALVRENEDFRGRCGPPSTARSC